MRHERATACCPVPATPCHSMQAVRKQRLSRRPTARSLRRYGRRARPSRRARQGRCGRLARTSDNSPPTPRRSVLLTAFLRTRPERAGPDGRCRRCSIFWLWIRRRFLPPRRCVFRASLINRGWARTTERARQQRMARRAGETMPPVAAQPPVRSGARRTRRRRRLLARPGRRLAPLPRRCSEALAMGLRVRMTQPPRASVRLR